MLRPIHTYHWRTETELHALLDALEAQDGLLSEQEHRHYNMILLALKKRELAQNLRTVEREIRKCEEEELEALEQGRAVWRSGN